MIVWLASYPRSGNTFFRIVLNQVYGIKTYSIYNDPLFDNLEGISDVVGHQKLCKSYEEMALSNQTFFIKTHHLPKTDNFPAIYLVRDGRDSVVSFANYIMSFQNKSVNLSWGRMVKNMFRKSNDNRDELLRKLIISSDSEYGSWSDNVNQWKSRSALTFILNFEDLIQNPLVSVSNALKVVDVQKDFEMKQHSLPSFLELNSKWPMFFRKGKIGNFSEEISQELQSLFWKYHGKVMEEMGYNL